MNDEYKRPRECGNNISQSGVIWLSFPIQAEVVAHSPTPSIYNIADFLNGIGKNAAAAWDGWCSENINFGILRFLSEDYKSFWIFLSSFLIIDFKNNFSFNQTCITAIKDRPPLGAVPRYVSNNLSNVSKGFS